MARGREQHIEHLLRRAAFGATEEDVARYSAMPYVAAVERLLTYDNIPDDVDSKIGQSGYVGITARAANGFQPQSNIDDARQRWLFRMVHSQRPLQEKMALFWHNHFATAYSKIAGTFNGTEATRMLASKPSDDPDRVVGQIELFRQNALGNFRDLLTAVAKDPAMLVWLDGRLNVRGRPQENFARELMELFTMGVGTFQETDVYAGARVFTGWNLARPNNGYYAFTYVAGQHDIDAKEFSFPIYANGGRVIPARAAAQGMQDGTDLIDAVVRHPATGPRLARKLYDFFMNETDAPDQAPHPHRGGRSEPGFLPLLDLGTLQLNPLTDFTYWTFDVSIGVALRTVRLPDDPGLVGLRVLFQTGFASITPSLQFKLLNAACFTIR